MLSTKGTFLGSCARALALQGSRTFAIAKGPQNVIFVDPRRLLDPPHQDAPADSADAAAGSGGTTNPRDFVRLALPAELVAALPRANFVQGDKDMPANSWLFGETASLKEYQYWASHKVSAGYGAFSGFSSALTEERWKELQDPAARKRWASWDRFIELYKADEKCMVSCEDHPELPFLWAGVIKDAGSASVYRLLRGREARQVGLMVASEADMVD